MKFTANDVLLPCPIQCAATLSNASFNGAISGLDSSLRPFVARFQGLSNATGSMSDGQACTADPSGELIGGGGAYLTVTGGQLEDNGLLTAASATIGLNWWQYGTALVLFPDPVVVYDASGNIVSNSILGGGVGVGVLDINWTNGVIPLDCGEQFPADLTVAGAIGVAA